MTNEDCAACEVCSQLDGYNVNQCTRVPDYFKCRVFDVLEDCTITCDSIDLTHAHSSVTLSSQANCNADQLTDINCWTRPNGEGPFCMLDRYFSFRRTGSQGSQYFLRHTFVYNTGLNDQLILVYQQNVSDQFGNSDYVCNCFSDW